MRALIIAFLQVIAYLGILAATVAGAVLGRSLAARPDIGGLLGEPLVGLVAGAVAGLAAGVAIFGPVILLADIRDQSRITAEALDRLGRRQRSDAGFRGRREAPLPPEPPVLSPRPPEPPGVPETPRPRSAPRATLRPG